LSVKKDVNAFSVFRSKTVSSKILVWMPTLDNHEIWCNGNGPGGKYEATYIADYLDHDKQPHVCRVSKSQCNWNWTTENGNPLTFLSLSMASGCPKIA
jgi:hypothetical protein